MAVLAETATLAEVFVRVMMKLKALLLLQGNSQIFVQRLGNYLMAVMVMAVMDELLSLMLVEHLMLGIFLLMPGGFLVQLRGLQLQILFEHLVG
jgi:hypothetical protein